MKRQVNTSNPRSVSLLYERYFLINKPKDLISSISITTQGTNLLLDLLNSSYNSYADIKKEKGNVERSLVPSEELLRT